MKFLKALKQAAKVAIEVIITMAVAVIIEIIHQRRGPQPF